MFKRAFSSLLALGVFLAVFVVVVGVPAPAQAASVDLMYVANLGSDEIRVYDLVSNTYIPELSISVADPSALTLGPDGLIYVSSRSAGQVQRYNLAGDFVDVFITGLAGPNGLLFTTYDYDGAAGPLGPVPVLLVADQLGGNVQAFDTNANFLGIFGADDPFLTNPTDMIGIGSFLYVTDGTRNEVRVYESTFGTFSGAFTAPGLAGPTDIINVDGFLYVPSNAGDGRIKEFTPGVGYTGDALDTITCGTVTPNSLFLRADGSVFLSDEVGNRVQRFDKVTGNCLDTDVTAIADAAAGSSLSGPTDIAFFTILDTDNDGVFDVLDACPFEFGTQDDGCPVIIVEPPDGGGGGTDVGGGDDDDDDDDDDGGTIVAGGGVSISIDITSIAINIGTQFVTSLQSSFVSVVSVTQEIIQTTVYSRQINVQTTEGQAAIGNMELLQQEILYAAEIYTLETNVVSFTQEIQVCMLGTGSIAYLETRLSPRPVQYLAVAQVAQYTCTTVTAPGILVLVNNSRSTIVSAAQYSAVLNQLGVTTTQTAAATTTTTTVAAGAVSLSNCQVTTTNILNFRREASLQAEVVTTIPYLTPMTAVARTSDWYNVVYREEVGWVSAQYVTTSGDCN